MTKKPFSSTSINNKELREKIVLLAKEEGVKRVTFNNRAKKVRGTYNAFTGALFVSLKQTKKDLLNAFFHELGHHWAVKNKKWDNYHFNLVSEMEMSEIFDIENDIDKIANKLWNKFVDTKRWGKYKFIYLKKRKNKMIKQLIDNKLV